MRYELGFEQFTVIVSDENDRREWTAVLSRLNREGNESRIFHADHKDLAEFNEVLSFDGKRQGERFSIRFGNLPENYQHDFELSIYDGKEVCFSDGGANRVGYIHETTLKAQQLIESLKDGVSWEQWCHKEGIEVRDRSEGPGRTELDFDRRYLDEQARKRRTPSHVSIFHGSDTHEVARVDIRALVEEEGKDFSRLNDSVYRRIAGFGGDWRDNPDVRIFKDPGSRNAISAGDVLAYDTGDWFRMGSDGSWTEIPRRRQDVAPSKAAGQETREHREPEIPDWRLTLGEFEATAFQDGIDERTGKARYKVMLEHGDEAKWFFREEDLFKFAKAVEKKAWASSSPTNVPLSDECKRLLNAFGAEMRDVIKNCFREGRSIEEWCSDNNIPFDGITVDDGTSPDCEPPPLKKGPKLGF